MLEYSKLILSKVSFHSGLFEKELKKAVNILMPHEVQELFQYVKINHEEYRELIQSIQNLF